MDRVTAIWHMLDAILNLGCHRMKRVSLTVQLGAALEKTSIIVTAAVSIDRQ